MKLDLTDKVALVTGASRGLGEATAEALLQNGAKVFGTARNASRLARLQNEYKPNYAALAGDLLSPEFPKLCVQEAIAHFNRLDILLVNTPGPEAIDGIAVTESDFNNALNTVLYPAFRLINAVLPHMQHEKYGRILIVSSTSMRAPKSFLSLSAASRSALWAWAKSVAPDLYQHGITINALVPGPHDTDRIRELNRTERPKGNPKDFARLAATLCGTASNFITGTTITLDGGELNSISL